MTMTLMRCLHVLLAVILYLMCHFVAVCHNVDLERVEVVLERGNALKHERGELFDMLSEYAVLIL